MKQQRGIFKKVMMGRCQKWRIRKNNWTRKTSFWKIVPCVPLHIHQWLVSLKLKCVVLLCNTVLAEYTVYQMRQKLSNWFVIMLLICLVLRCQQEIYNIVYDACESPTSFISGFARFCCSRPHSTHRHIRAIYRYVRIKWGRSVFVI